jgi:hypothetical protein
MSVTVARADLFDLAALGGATSRAQWHLVRDIADRGDTYALREDGDLIGLAFFVPIGEIEGMTVIEVNFNPAPAASRAMLGIVRAARLTIEASPYRAIVTICRSEAGKRFAALAGFFPAGQSERGEVWIHGRRADGADGPEQPEERRPLAGAAEKPDRLGAAHEPGAAGLGAG